MVYIGSTDEKCPFVYTSAFFDEYLFVCFYIQPYQIESFDKEGDFTSFESTHACMHVYLI